MQRNAPEARQLIDIAFSGNGEPTSAAEFEAAVLVVARVLAQFELAGSLPVRLITNGSLLHRPNVQSAIRHIGLLGGEVWFKIDRAKDAEVAQINGIPGDRARVLKNLRSCAALAPTWRRSAELAGLCCSVSERRCSTVIAARSNTQNWLCTLLVWQRFLQ